MLYAIIAELTLAVENDFHSIVVDNFDEIEMIEEVAKALGKRARVRRLKSTLRMKLPVWDFRITFLKFCCLWKRCIRLETGKRQAKSAIFIPAIF